MKNKLIIFCFFIIVQAGNLSAQFTCATATTITDGACLTGEVLGSSQGGWMTGCNGGNHPIHYYSFTVPSNGDCVQFDFTGITTGGTWQYRIMNSTCTAYPGTTYGCIENVVAGKPFSISGVEADGDEPLIAGSTYILEIMGDASSTYNICMNSPSTYAAADACGGALGLGTTSTTYYNGGDCNYSGSYDNAASVDEPAAEMCAGSLENTQWVKFTAAAGATSITISGSNISCAGGGCGFQFGIQSGACGSLTNQGCYGNKACTGGQSTAGPTDVAGGYTMTWSNTTTSGFDLTISGLSGSGGQEFYLIMDGNADADCQYTLVGTNIVPLPIELISFTGRLENNAVRLDWSTASEINNNFFIVERSTYKYNFETIDTVKGAGNSSSFLSYNFYDEKPIHGTAYYRLKQVDYDGQYSYSKIIYVNHLSDEDATLDIIPNPVSHKGQLFFHSKEEGIVSMNVYDTRGVLISSKQFPAIKGDNIQQFETSEFPKGIYYVSLIDSYKVLNTKFIKE